MARAQGICTSKSSGLETDFQHMYTLKVKHLDWYSYMFKLKYVYYFLELCARAGSKVNNSCI